MNNQDGGDKDNCYVVYKHTNKINGKVYIGQTKRKPEIRWNNGKGYRCSSHFYSAIQKYGWENFEHEILKEKLSSEDADYWEKYYINLYHSTDDKCGYNLRSGGKDNYVLNEQGVKNLKKSVTRGEKAYNARRVKCVETQDVFPCIRDAERWSGTNKIAEQIAGTRHHAGTHPDTGELLTWEEVDNDTPITKRCPEELIPSKPRKDATRKRVMCINTGQIFNSCAEAAFWYSGTKGNSSCVKRCCTGERQTAGKHPITGEKLKWKLVEKEKEN